MHTHTCTDKLARYFSIDLNWEAIELHERWNTHVSHIHLCACVCLLNLKQSLTHTNKNAFWQTSFTRTLKYLSKSSVAHNQNYYYTGLKSRTSVNNSRYASFTNFGSEILFLAIRKPKILKTINEFLEIGVSQTLFDWILFTFIFVLTGFSLVLTNLNVHSRKQNRWILIGVSFEMKANAYESNSTLPLSDDLAAFKRLTIIQKFTWIHLLIVQELCFSQYPRCLFLATNSLTGQKIVQ